MTLWPTSAEHVIPKDMFNFVLFMRILSLFTVLEMSFIHTDDHTR